jgi:hypothetical protein
MFNTHMKKHYAQNKLTKLFFSGASFDAVLDDARPLDASELLVVKHTFKNVVAVNRWSVKCLTHRFETILGSEPDSDRLARFARTAARTT